MRFNDDIHIDFLCRRDMYAVLQIERWCFPKPWCEEDFVHALRRSTCIGMAARQYGVIVGFMLYEMHANRLHLLNLAVDPKHQRSGVGTAMIAKLRAKLTRDGRNRIECESCESNLGAHLFLRTMGFRAISVIRDYCDDGQDAYQFQLCHWAEEVKTIQTKEGVRWGR